MPVFLDTETTGLSPAKGDMIVEIAIVNDDGRTMIDTLVDPGRSIPWQASRIHGITQEMVRGKPSLTELMPRIMDIVRGEEVVIYNANFDAPFFPGRLAQASAIRCAMIQFAEAQGGGRWRKLDVAAQHVGHRWTGAAHRALADAQACRSVWQWLRLNHLSSSAGSGSAQAQSSASMPATKTVIICPGCAQRLRVPEGKRMEVTCTRCRMKFPAQT